jgi:hypothetical protein
MFKATSETVSKNGFIIVTTPRSMSQFQNNALKVY